MIRKDIIPVDQWLVLGSFPLYERRRGHWLNNGYPCEPQFAPREGDAFDGRKWKRYQGEHLDFLNPSLAFTHRAKCFAYAATYLYSPRRQNVRLMIGSDDGVAVWLDGKQVHYVETERPLNPEEDLVPVTLSAGWHVLVCKVSQYQFRWDLTLRVTGTRPGQGAEAEFSWKRPKEKLRSGLQGRRKGLVWGSPVPRIDLEPNHEAVNLNLGFHLFNDSEKESGRYRATLRDEAGTVYGRPSQKNLQPFSSWEVSLDLGQEGLLEAFASGRPLRLHAANGKQERTFEIAEGLEGALFHALAGGYSVPLDPEARIGIPKVFRGQEAEIRILSGPSLPLSREISWPDLPSRVATPAETRGGSVRMGLEAPRHIPGLQAQMVPGDAELRACIRRMLFHVEQVGADPAAGAEAARSGLRAWAEGDYAGVKAAMAAFEQALAKSLPDRSSHRAILVGHGHIDMNWLWTSSETLQCCHDMFRQVLTFMDEFPQFHFSQSQASTYRYIELHDPGMFERIRQRVKEGRWELLGGAVTEGDTNLSSGEGIVRTLLYGQRYFQSRFGRRAQVGWLPDNFGHVAQLPQLLNLAGIKYFYGFRCQPALGTYRWQGIDGTQTLNFTTPTYNGAVTPELREIPEQYDPKHKKAMWVYGVGDHGGGPSRRDITRALDYQASAGFPKIEFGKAEDFFKSIEPHAGDYPVHAGELQYIFEGCYTSIARIKEANRRCENTLYAAELLSALNALEGEAYPGEIFERVWERVAYNQFHDILCGSAIHASNRESIGVYDALLAEAEETRFAALRSRAAGFATRRAEGRPLVVFNPLPRKRTDIVEVEVFSYQAPPTANPNHWGHFDRIHVEPVDIGQGPYATVELEDEKGSPVPAQIVRGKLFPNGYRLKVQFLAKDVPACGSRIFYIRADQPGQKPEGGLKVQGTTVETPWLRVEVDPRTGNLNRVYDRKRKKEVLSKGEAGNLLKVYMEKPHGMSAWCIGPISEVIALEKAESVRVVEQGPVRAVIEVERKWDRSSFTQRIIVYRDLPRVDFELDARWFQVGGPEADAPMLRVAFPLNVKRGKFYCDTPFAAVERPVSGREVPAQKWTDLSGISGGAALLNDSKYGHSCTDSTLEMTLLRASYDPDRYPDQGPHAIHYSLFPHEGDWIAGQVQQTGLEFNLPLEAIEMPPNEKGSGCAEESLWELGPGNLFPAAFKKSEDRRAWIVRFFEGHGQSANAVIRLAHAPKKAVRANLLEEPVEGAAAPSIEGNSVRVKVKPHEIVTLRLEF